MRTTMRTMKTEAFAKVNLTLEVLGERADGFHALRSLVVPISLADTIEIEPADTIETDTGYGEQDLCWKAARALKVGARISVRKRIPAGGGLGGGSADAAATLRALNGLYRLGHTPEELAAIGATFGSDVPALVLAQHYRRPVLMEGRGEIVTRAAPVPHRHLVLVNPGVFSSTPEVFRAFRHSTYPTPANDLQTPAIALHPEIGTALVALTAAGATGAMMTGSGSTVFGYAREAAEAGAIAAHLKSLGYRAWNAEFLV
ncbi:MAG: 4-(cytidine 5'-diphospho)-2-C-methyl-D-erythritol kinase [Kiritimatiellia bacterium]